MFFYVFTFIWVCLYLCMLVFSSELCKFQGYFVAALHPFVQAVFFPVWSAHNSLLSYMTAKHSTLTSLQNFPMTNEVVLHVNPPVSTPLESSLISFTVFWLFLVSKGRPQWKKNVFFWALPELPKPPPPHDPNSGNLVLFFRKSKFKIWKSV